MIQPHAVAEDEVLWEMAATEGDEGMKRAAQLLEEEHRRTDQMIARYEETLARAEQGQAPLSDLV